MIKEQKSIVLSPNCAASHYSVCIRRSSDHLSKLAENNSNGKQWLLVIACVSFQGTLFWSLTNCVLIFYLKMTNEWCAVFLFKHFCRSSLWYYSYPNKRFPWTYKLTKKTFAYFYNVIILYENTCEQRADLETEEAVKRFVFLPYLVLARFLLSESLAQAMFLA